MRTKFLVRFIGVLTLGLVALSSLDAQAAPVIQTRAKEPSAPLRRCC